MVLAALHTEFLGFSICVTWTSVCVTSKISWKTDQNMSHWPSHDQCDANGCHGGSISGATESQPLRRRTYSERRHAADSHMLHNNLRHPIDL